MIARLTFVHALTPLHPGIGQGAGVIDLPIAREQATGIPYLPGSSLKGALRTRCYNQGDRQKCELIFGPPTPDNSDNPASQILFTDQRLLLFPARSLAGIFAWVSSPYILRRLLRDVHNVQGEFSEQTIPPFASVSSCYVAGSSAIRFKNTVSLEDLNLQANSSPDVVTHWAQWLGPQIFPDPDDQWQTLLTQHLCIVHDDVLNFMLTTATEVIARIRLDETSKTVQQSGFWYEEALPTETVLSGIVVATPRVAQDDRLDKSPNARSNGKSNALTATDILSEITSLTTSPLQLGGKATIGRGLCRIQVAKE